MKQSQLFTKTQRNAPKDETSVNAQLLMRAGFIHKEMAGVYAFLPLGLRVVENIKSIIRQEMQTLDSQELVMTVLQRKELWEKTDRWDDRKVDIWFKSKLKNNTEVGLGWSHEEQITEMMKGHISSYRDLPVNVFQFQNKLRNETRAKSGIMRCREFLMKDQYSYSLSEEEHKVFYDSVIAAYLRIFERMGLGGNTFLTFASGGAFTQFSHEFQTITDSGEDIIYLHREKKIAINQEVLTEEVMSQLGVKRDELEELKAAEVGNIFSFGGTKSEQLGLLFKDEKGVMKPVILGSYGIGVTRLMGTIVEIFNDKRGIIWPESVAPFAVHILSLNKNVEAEKLYDELTEKGVEVLYDDREVSAGEKFADADLIGIPFQLIVSEKNMKENKIEIKNRKTGEKEFVKLSVAEIIKYFSQHK